MKKSYLYFCLALFISAGLFSDGIEPFGSGTGTSYSYQAPIGRRLYKVSARNANGFSEWSDAVEFAVPE